MENSDNDGPAVRSTRSYHHGDLRSALISATKEALLDQHPDTISLKALALRLGVSQPAPYRHFKTREGLLSAVAADGFIRLNEILTQDLSWQTAVVNKVTFRRLCEAYIEFGLSNLGVYRLMHSRGPMNAAASDSELSRASDASFKSLISKLPPRATYQEAAALAVFVWSTLHGIIILQGEGFIAGALEASASAPDIIRDVISDLSAVIFRDDPQSRDR